MPGKGLVYVLGFSSVFGFSGGFAADATGLQDRFGASPNAAIPVVPGGEEGEKKTPSKGSRDKKETAERYYVVRVGTELKVLGKAELDETRKKVDAEYKKDLKSYEEKKREAAKKKERFTGERPTKARISVLRSGLASREKAAEALGKLEEDEKGRESRSSRSSRTARSSFAVVQIADELRVVESGELTSLKSGLDKEYKEALDKYRKDQREAAKRGEKFTEKPPVRKAFKILASKLPSKEKADEMKDKFAARTKKTPASSA